MRQPEGSTTQRHIEALQRTDTGFFKALLAGDIRALESLLAEDFLIVDVASGSVHRRGGFLLAIAGGAVIFQEIKTFPEESVTRLTGPGAGIVIGRTAISFCGGAGAAAGLASRYTHVFQADNPLTGASSIEGSRRKKVSWSWRVST
jgi:ketosteroid isomerase-like protein